MGNVAVIGAQWGDEGKGKVVDWLASRADIVVRFQGGHNAGHTLIVGNQTYKLSLLPSGLVRGKLGIIGNGVVIDPDALLAEIARVQAQGLVVTADSLRIADNATLILPVHAALGPGARDGTGCCKNRHHRSRHWTRLRGQGGSSRHTCLRLGRAGDALGQARRAAAASQHAARRPWRSDLREGGAANDPAWLGAAYPAARRAGVGAARRGSPRRPAHPVRGRSGGDARCRPRHPTPFVTSSNTVAATAASGSGIGPAAVGFVLGIAKAYTTRVGSGPFPTELHDDTGRLLGERGHEFGTVTGRPRRCGWFDAVLVRQAVKVGGVGGLALTKLDVLDGLSTLQICVGYEVHGETFKRLPAGKAAQAAARPVYETIEGWTQSTRGARSWGELPAQAVKYVKRIEELVEAPVTLLSTSPERDDMILVRDPFEG